MKLALAVNCWNDEDLMYAKQFGATHVVGEAIAPEGVQWVAGHGADVHTHGNAEGIDGLTGGVERLGPGDGVRRRTRAGAYDQP